MNRTLFQALIALAVAPPCLAQWTVTNLHPDGASESYAPSLGPGLQTGSAVFDGVRRAGYWQGSAASWTDLHPADAIESRAGRFREGLLLGVVEPARFESRAVLWPDGLAPLIDITPPETTRAIVADVLDGNPVGWVRIAGFDRASVWEGLTTAWTDLTPPEAESAKVNNAHNGQLVGEVRIDRVAHAALWEGDGSSWTNLNPPGAEGSVVVGVHNGQQVGALVFPGDITRAALWRGTAESWVDLTPPGADFANAGDTFAGWQVGYVRLEGPGSRYHRASLWNGTADSWEDLSVELPGAWLNTYAIEVWADAGTLYVVGWGYNLDTDRNEALLWTRPLDGCRVDFDGDGALTIFDFLAFQTAFDAGDPFADLDGDGDLTVFDFLAFQAAFDAGCP